MKRVLLDTHAFLWALDGSADLGHASRALIADPTNVVYVSSASIWEASIKTQQGKLSAPNDLDGYIAKMGFIELPISAYHAKQAARLDWHHKDPFDRMLVAQAHSEGLMLVTADSVIAQYDIEQINARS